MNWLKNKKNAFSKNASSLLKGRRSSLEPLEERQLLAATLSGLEIAGTVYTAAQLESSQSGVGYTYTAGEDGSVLTLDGSFAQSAPIVATGSLTIVLNGRSSISVPGGMDAIKVSGDLELVAQTGYETDSISISGGVRVEGSLTVEGVSAATGKISDASPNVVFNGARAVTHFISTETQLKGAFSSASISSGTTSKPNQYLMVVTADVSISQKSTETLTVPACSEVTMVAAGTRTITRTNNNCALFTVYKPFTTNATLSSTNTAVNRSAVLNLGASDNMGTISLTIDGGGVSGANPLVDVSGTFNLLGSATLTNAVNSTAHSNAQSMGGGGAIAISGLSGWAYNHQNSIEANKKYVGLVNIVGGTISNCRASAGVAGAIEDFGELNFVSGTISDCYAYTEGGAIRLRGLYSMTGGTIENCGCGELNAQTSITNKTTLNAALQAKQSNIDGGKGGGVHVSEYGYATVSGANALITDCWASRFGGAMYVGGSGRAYVSLTAGTIEKNVAPLGGGIAANSTLELSGSALIRLNEAYLRDASGNFYTYVQNGSTWTFAKVNLAAPEAAKVQATKGRGNGLYVFTADSPNSASQLLVGGGVKIDTSNEVYFANLVYSKWNDRPTVPVYVFQELTCDGVAMLISTDNDSGLYSGDKYGDSNALQLSSIPLVRFANELTTQETKFAVSSNVWSINQADGEASRTREGATYTSSSHANYYKYLNYMRGQNNEGGVAKNTWYTNAKTSDLPSGEGQYLVFYRTIDAVASSVRINDMMFDDLDACLDFVERHSMNESEKTLTELGLLDYGSSSTKRSLTIYLKSNTTLGYTHNLHCDYLHVTLVSETYVSTCLAMLEYGFGWSHQGGTAGTIVEGDLDTLLRTDADSFEHLYQKYDATLVYKAFLQYCEKIDPANLVDKTEAELKAVVDAIDIYAEKYRENIATIDGTNVDYDAVGGATNVYRIALSNANGSTISSATHPSVSGATEIVAYATLNENGFYYQQQSVDYAGNYSIVWNATNLTLTITDKLANTTSGALSYELGANSIVYKGVTYEFDAEANVEPTTITATARSYFDLKGITHYFGYAGLATYDSATGKACLYDTVNDSGNPEIWTPTDAATVVLRADFKSYPSLYASTKDQTLDPSAWYDENGAHVLDYTQRDYAAISVGNAFGGHLTLGSGVFFDGEYRYPSPTLFAVEGGSALIMEEGSEIRNVRDRTLSGTSEAEQFMGAGAVVVYNGSFEMNGGTIIGCTGFHGGAIYVSTYGTMTMNGGTITDCDGGAINDAGDIIAHSGAGAIYNMGTLNLNGGQIVGNRGYWGGIYNGYGSTLNVKAIAMSDNTNDVDSAYIGSYVSEGLDYRRGDIDVFFAGDSFNIVSDAPQTVAIDGIVYLGMNVKSAIQKTGVDSYTSAITVKTTVDFLAEKPLLIDTYETSSYMRVVQFDLDGDDSIDSPEEIAAVKAFEANGSFEHIYRVLSQEYTLNATTFETTFGPYLIFNVNRIYYVNTSTSDKTEDSHAQIDHAVVGVDDKSLTAFEAPIYLAPDGKVYFVGDGGVLTEIPEGESVTYSGNFRRVSDGTVYPATFTYVNNATTYGDLSVAFNAVVDGVTYEYVYKNTQYDGETVSFGGSLRVDSANPGTTPSDVVELAQKNKSDLGESFGAMLATFGYACAFNADNTVELTIFGDTIAENRVVKIAAAQTEYYDDATGLYYYVARNVDGTATQVKLLRDGRGYLTENQRYGVDATYSPTLTIVDIDGVEYDFRTTLYDGKLVYDETTQKYVQSHNASSTDATTRVFTEISTSASFLPTELTAAFQEGGEYYGKNYQLFRTSIDMYGVVYLVLKSTTTVDGSTIAETFDNWRYRYESVYAESDTPEPISLHLSENVYDATNNAYLVESCELYNYLSKTSHRCDYTYANDSAPTINDLKTALFTLTDAKGIVETNVFTARENAPRYDGRPYLDLTQSTKTFGTHNGGFEFNARYEIEGSFVPSYASVQYNNIENTGSALALVPVATVDSEGAPITTVVAKNVDLVSTVFSTKTANDCRDDATKETFARVTESGVPYAFIGWNTEKDGSGTWIYPSSAVNNTVDITQHGVLFAQWAVNVVNTTKDEFDLTFNEDLGIYVNNNAYLSLREAIYIATYYATQTDATFVANNETLIQRSQEIVFESNPENWEQYVLGEAGWSVEVDGGSVAVFPEIVNFNLTESLTISSALTLDGFVILNSGNTTKDKVATADATTIRITAVAPKRIMTFAANGTDASKVHKVTYDAETGKYVESKTEYAPSKATTETSKITMYYFDFYDGGDDYGVKKYNGGGLYVRANTFAEVENCDFLDCQGWYGGAIANYGDLDLTNVLISTSKTENSRTNLDMEKISAYVGGGIYNAGTMTIQNSTIEKTSVDGMGGGVANVGTLIGTGVYVQHCIAVGTGDQVGGYGGGFANQGVAKFTLLRLLNNYASENGGGMTNIYVATSESDPTSKTSITLSRSLLQGNVAQYNGGGLFNGSTAVVEGSTFTGNSTTIGSGGAIYNSWYGEAGALDRQVRDGNVDPGGVARGTLTITSYPAAKKSDAEVEGHKTREGSAEETNASANALSETSNATEGGSVSDATEGSSAAGYLNSVFQQNVSAGWGGAIYDGGNPNENTLTIEYATFGAGAYANVANSHKGHGASLSTWKTDWKASVMGDEVVYVESEIHVVVIDELTAQSYRASETSNAILSAVDDGNDEEENAPSPFAPGSVGESLSAQFGSNILSAKVKANGSDWIELDLNGSLIDVGTPLKSGWNDLWFSVHCEGDVYESAPGTVFVLDVDPTVAVAVKSLDGANVLSVSVKVDGEAPISSWVLDWGDGTTTELDEFAFEANFAHRYATSGEYRATLKLVDADGFGLATVYDVATWVVDANDAPAGEYAAPNEKFYAVETSAVDAKAEEGDYVASDVRYDDAEPATLEAVDRAVLAASARAVQKVDSVFDQLASQTSDDELETNDAFYAETEEAFVDAVFAEETRNVADLSAFERADAPRRRVFDRFGDSSFDFETLDSIFDERSLNENR